jgi:hypothetical protein
LGPFRLILSFRLTLALLLTLHPGRLFFLIIAWLILLYIFRRGSLLSTTSLLLLLYLLKCLSFLHYSELRSLLMVLLLVLSVLTPRAFPSVIFLMGLFVLLLIEH